MRSITITLLVLFSAVACAEGSDEDATVDTIEDTGSDSALDTAVDTAVDPEPDGTSDPDADDPADTIEDSPPDTAVEPDVPMDTPVDTGSDTATETGTDTDDEDGGSPPYSHTIVIDGTNDFSVTDEQFATSSSGYAAYVAWDATHLYLGMEGPDLSSASSDLWVLVYLGGASGSSTGQIYNSQQPTLPFAAATHVRWRVSNDYTNALGYSGTWSDLGWDFTGDVYLSGTFMEMRIPLADIGSPASLDLAMYMINEAGGSEWSWAACPASAITDGHDPDLAAYYSFVIGGITVPTDHSPL